MFLDILFFSFSDLYLVPVCLLLLYAILRSRANRVQDKNVQKLYYQAFYFKIACVLAYSIITEFYFEGGDTNLYYHGIKYIRQAVADDLGMLNTTLTSSSLSPTNPLAPYFMYGDYGNGISYNYMLNAGNFFVCRLGLIPALLFFDNYLCISLCFSFFALGGAIRLFKTFYHYYPNARKELALATLFLPSVGYWSAGLLKDTICFGCVGFLLYGILSVFILRKNILASILWIIISAYILYIIKAYILLTLILAVLIWLFFETNKLVKDVSMRNFLAVITLLVAVVVGFFLVRFVTSTESLKQYQLENIISSAEYQRSNYEYRDRVFGGETSYYEINTSNYFLLILNSIATTFFRPFIWEVKSSAAVLSAIEALGFLLLTAYLFFKKGLIAPFKTIFKDPRLAMAFVFAIIFSIGVGISTANFGALSRYKIPCLPFYLIAILLTYRQMTVPYPKWFKKILSR